MTSGSRFERPESEADWRRLLGRKVSLRYRLPAPSETPFSEAIGVVAAVTDEGSGTAISVLSKRGETNVVPLADIEAAKVFPL